MVKIINRLAVELTHFFFLPSKKCIIGLSLGQDSICLFLFIFVIRRQWDLSLLSCYCNHFWQIKSFDTQYHLLKYNYLLQNTFFIFFSLNFLKTELNARNWRYFCYAHLSFEQNARTLFLGHTKSDKIETFLFNLCRGVGVNGLRSIPFSRKLRTLKTLIFFRKKKMIVFDPLKQIKKSSVKPNFRNIDLQLLRPLIFINRYEISQFCHFYNLPIQTDKTNFKISYFRNRFRHQVLPFLRFYLNPKIDLTLSRFLNVFDLEISYLNAITENTVLNFSLKTYKKKIVLFHLKYFSGCPYAVQKRLLIQILRTIKTTLNWSVFEQVFKLIFLRTLSRPIDEEKMVFFSVKNKFLISFWGPYIIIKQIGSDGI